MKTSEVDNLPAVSNRGSGWTCLTCLDGRRGVWMKVTATTVELCAGREGGDAYVKFVVGEVVSVLNIVDAEAIRDYFWWGQEVADSNAGSMQDEAREEENA